MDPLYPELFQGVIQYKNVGDLQKTTSLASSPVTTNFHTILSILKDKMVEIEELEYVDAISSEVKEDIYRIVTKCLDNGDNTISRDDVCIVLQVYSLISRSQ